MKRLIAGLYGALLCLSVHAQAAPTVSITVTTGNTPKIDYTCQTPYTVATATSVPNDPAWSGVLPSLTGSKVGTPITDTRTYTIGCATVTKNYFDLTITNATMNTDGSALTDLFGYDIYRGSSASNLTLLKTIPATAGLTTVYRDAGLAPGTYFYKVVTVNAAQLRSADGNVGNGTNAAAQSVSAASTLKVPAATTVTVAP